MEIYGTAVADKLDNEQGLLRRRYYRQHCTLDFGSYTKDLSAICSDLSSVFILDNSPGAYRSYPGINPYFFLIFFSQFFINFIITDIRYFCDIFLNFSDFQITQFLSSLGSTIHTIRLCSTCCLF